MLRALDGPIPTAPIPPGHEIRAVVESGETVNRAGAEREVWLPSPDGDISGDDYARLMRLPGYDRELEVVAVAPDGVIASFTNGLSA